jgi:hypothetical protein
MPTKNKMADLRNHLFEAIEQLKDPETPMEIDRAKAICAVAQTIINSAKVEVDYLKMGGQAKSLGSDFIEPAKPALPPPPPPSTSRPNGGPQRLNAPVTARGLSTGKDLGSRA